MKTVAMWDNKTRPNGAGNTIRPLTRSLDLSERQAAMKATRKLCSVDDCDRPSHARGWCTRHYQIWKRNGHPTRLLADERPELCQVDGCDKGNRRGGYCGAHYARFLRHGDPLGGGADRRPLTDGCTVDGCDQPHRVHGMCQNHWRRWQYANDPEFVERRRSKWRAWATRNAESQAARAKAWRDANPARRAELLAEWKAANPWHASLYSYAKRRRNYGLPMLIVEKVDPFVLLARDGGRCQLCDDPIDVDLLFPDPMALTVDHVNPVADPESEHSYANTQAAHWHCNRRKNSSKESA